MARLGKTSLSDRSEDDSGPSLVASAGNGASSRNQPAGSPQMLTPGSTNWPLWQRPGSPMIADGVISESSHPLAGELAKLAILSSDDFRALQHGIIDSLPEVYATTPRGEYDAKLAVWDAERAEIEHELDRRPVLAEVAKAQAKLEALGSGKAT